MIYLVILLVLLILIKNSNTNIINNNHTINTINTINDNNTNNVIIINNLLKEYRRKLNLADGLGLVQFAKFTTTWGGI